MSYLRLRRLKVIWLVSMMIIFSAGSAFGATDTETLKRLEQLITRQQAQIETQARAIEDLKKQVQALTKASEQKPVAAQTQAAAEKVVQSSSDKVSVKLYGQVNRGVLYTDDGNDNYLYHVDNDNSSTRIGLLGKSHVNSDIQAGTRIEVEFQANASNEVDQNNENRVGDNNFKKRQLDLFFDSKNYGKLSLGWGNTASDGTSEVDLSGTAVIGFSRIGAMAGGHLFYDADTGSLSATRIRNVMDNMDGLGRDDRIRYDTPKFYGFRASASNVSGGGNDVALRYSARIGTVKLAGAAAYGDPIDSSSVENQLNGSISALHNSGFNLTVAAGNQDFKASGRNDATFYYSKLGYRRQFFSTGMTALAVDYGKFEELEVNDDDADTFGAMVVQDFAKWGTEYYLGYRNHKLDRTGTDFKSIDAILTGFRVKF